MPLNPDGTPVDDPGRASQADLKDLVESLADTQVCTVNYAKTVNVVEIWWRKRGLHGHGGHLIGGKRDETHC